MQTSISDDIYAKAVIFDWIICTNVNIISYKISEDGLGVSDERNDKREQTL